MPRSRRLALAVLATVAMGGLWLVFRSEPPPSIPRQALSRDAAQRPAPARRIPSLPQLSSDPPILAAASGGVPAERRFHPRDPREWQGMLVATDLVPPCEASATCGLARACKGGKCVACSADDDCAAGEVCVLDHCVVRALAGCRNRADCVAGSLCILSGYSSEARGNEGMRSLCLDPASGAARMPEPEPAPPDPRTRLPDDDLLQRAAEAARAN